MKPKPRPLYRSLSFWLGIPGLLFILWSWRDSLAHVAGIFRSVTIHSPELTIGMNDMIGYRSGGFRVMIHTLEPVDEARVPRSIHRGPVTMDHDKLLPGLVGHQASPRVDWRNMDPDFANPGVGLTGVVIPHWLALILYGAAWGAVMVWRRRRIRRAEGAALTER